MFSSRHLKKSSESGKKPPMIAAMPVSRGLVILLPNENARPKIYVNKLKSVNDVEQTVKKGIESIGGLSLARDTSVVIKPNLCCIKSPETGATTDVKVVEGLVKYLKNEFSISDISIVESDGTQVLADMAFKLLGYETLSKRLNIKLVNLTKCPFSIKKFPENVFVKEIQIPKAIEEADFMISVPKIKTHIDCLYTGALKNQFGCNPYPRKAKYHRRINDAIVDLYAVFRPDLVLVDGIVGMEGYRGPTDGLPVKMNVLVLGRDAVAVDHFVARLVGLNPARICHLVDAEKRGLGSTIYEVTGIDIKEVSTKFRFIRPQISNFYGIFCKY
jgi:uncharacterized protein (DUF362 family)